ncbi:MAG: DUF997 family protein [Eubacteriales bacterium]|nr:DUF997 family protein [Eubacteriales bacterium]
MKPLTHEEKHAQCMKEIKATLIVALLTCAWECIWAFALNGTGLMFLGIPAWVSVSVFGSIIIAIGGCIFLLKKVFVDFDYDDELEEGGR